MMAAAASRHAGAAAPRLRPAGHDLPLWMLLVMRGVLLLAFGAAALAFPFTTLFSLAVLIGILVLADGALSLWRAGWRAARGTPGALPWLARGLAAALLGGAVLLAPLIATFAYATVGLALVACWFLLTGLADIGLGVRRRSGRTSMIWWGITLLLCGAAILALLATASASFLGLAWLIGLSALFAGITMVSRGLLLRAAV